jgi:hypothetical protein
MHGSILVAGDPSTHVVLSGLGHHPPEQEQFCHSVPGGVHLLYMMLQVGDPSATPSTSPPPTLFPTRIDAFPPCPAGEPPLSSSHTVTALELIRKRIDKKTLGPLGLKSVLGRYPPGASGPLPVPPAGVVPSLLVVCHLNDDAAPCWKDLAPCDDGATAVFTGHPSSLDGSWGCMRRRGARGRVIVVVPAEALRRSGCLVNPLSWEGALIDLYREATAARPKRAMEALAAADDVVVTLGAYAAAHGRLKGGAGPARPEFSLVACLDQAYTTHDHMLTNAGFAALQAAGIAAHVAATWDPADSMAGDLPAAVVNGINYCHRHVTKGFNPEGPGKVPGSGVGAAEAWCRSIATATSAVTPETCSITPTPAPGAGPRKNWSLLKKACAGVVFDGGCVVTGCTAFRRVFKLLTRSRMRSRTGKYDADYLARWLHFPIARFGKWTGIERDEIEGYQSLKQRIAAYVGERSVRPLCLAAFGPPGSGKSFGIKQLAKGLADEGMNVDPDVLEYNLAEFTETRGLVRALHRARDRALGGKVPLVLFDEFDSGLGGRPLGWLQYLLAPMWDGNFRDGDLQYNTGQAIFVFVGGTRRTFAEFSGQLRNRDFIDAKGPDFVSRLSGHVNVRGVNKVDEHDELYFVRRAVFLAEKVQSVVEDRILKAMLAVPTYRHGSRSLESLIKMCVPEGGRITRSSLPPEHQLDMHVDATRFFELLNQ